MPLGCGGLLEEEITADEWRCHVLDCQKLFSVKVPGPKEFGKGKGKLAIGHTADHRAISVYKGQLKNFLGKRGKRSWFYTLRSERDARNWLMQHHGNSMKETAAELLYREQRGETLSLKEREFRKTITCPFEVGYGRYGHNNYFHGVRVVSFQYYYFDGFWVEDTGYPDLEIIHKVDKFKPEQERLRPFAFPFEIED